MLDVVIVKVSSRWSLCCKFIRLPTFLTVLRYIYMFVSITHAQFTRVPEGYDTFHRWRSIRTGNLTIEMQRIRIVCENLHIACVISIKSNTTFRTNAVPHFDAAAERLLNQLAWNVVNARSFNAFPLCSIGESNNIPMADLR